MKTMNKFLIPFLCLSFCLYSCSDDDEMIEENVDEKVTEVYCSVVPETRVSEGSIQSPLNHEELVEAVKDRYYKLTAEYHCFMRNDSLFYVVQPCFSDSLNLNARALLVGGGTYHYNFADGYYTRWEEFIGTNPEANCRNFTYNEENQTFSGLEIPGHSTTDELKVMYADDKNIIMSADTVHTARPDQYDTTGQFARIVLQAVDKSQIPECEIVDERK